MNLTESDRRWLGWLLIVVLIVVSTIFGVKLPELPPMPETQRGHTGLTGLEVIAPTEQPTGTPAVIADNYGMSAIFEARDSATPVFAVQDTGLIYGQVLQYGSAGSKVVCNTTTITGTGAIAHGLATPVVVYGTIGEDLTGKSARLSFTNSAATVTFKVWNTALTPAASDEGIDVDWCVVGTP